MTLSKFKGTPVQYGYGIGGVLATMARFALPILTKVLTGAANQAATHTVNKIMSGRGQKRKFISNEGTHKKRKMSYQNSTRKKGRKLKKTKPKYFVSKSKLLDTINAINVSATKKRRIKKKGSKQIGRRTNIF